MSVKSKLDDHYRWLSSKGKYGQQATLRASDCIVGFAQYTGLVFNEVIFHEDFPINICYFADCGMVGVVWGTLPTKTQFCRCLISTFPDFRYVDSMAWDGDSTYMNNERYLRYLEVGSFK